MFDYKKQAKDFLKDCNAIMEIELIGCDIPPLWKEETHSHNHYRFTIKTPKGEMTDDFWDSLYNTQKRKQSFDEFCCKTLKKHERDLLPSEIIKYQKIWAKQRQECIPTEYDILSCLVTYLPDTFKDFCAEYGYDDDSISALKIYLACQEQWGKIRRIFTEEQIEKLSEIR